MFKTHELYYSLSKVECSPNVHNTYERYPLLHVLVVAIVIVAVVMLVPMPMPVMAMKDLMQLIVHQVSPREHADHLIRHIRHDEMA